MEPPTRLACHYSSALRGQLNLDLDGGGGPKANKSAFVLADETTASSSPQGLDWPD